ncbi:putative uncharacterized protein ENSP00000383309 [Zalophus californianus]|uniref:Uncharacterized protein n=1 Tax=Zalophus californianus TaxID=9704 RepID=A0A6P9F7D9_ZALCA|nr:putative uncharacterized protein ENSP00000383309 [Zalophus californianus]
MEQHCTPEPTDILRALHTRSDSTHRTSSHAASRLRALHLRTSPQRHTQCPDSARSTCGRPPSVTRSVPTRHTPPADVPPASHAMSRLRALHLWTSPQRHTQCSNSARSTCGRPPSVTRSVPDIARSTCGRRISVTRSIRAPRAPPADVPATSHAASRTSRAPPADDAPTSHAGSGLRALHLRTSPQRHTQRPNSTRSTCGRPPASHAASRTSRAPPADVPQRHTQRPGHRALHLRTSPQRHTQRPGHRALHLRTFPQRHMQCPGSARSTCGRPPSVTRSIRAPRAPPADDAPVSHAASGLRALHLRTTHQRHTQHPGSARSTCRRPPSVTRSVLTPRAPPADVPQRHTQRPDSTRSTCGRPPSVTRSVLTPRAPPADVPPASHAGSGLRALHLRTSPSVTRSVPDIARSTCGRPPSVTRSVQAPRAPPADVPPASHAASRLHALHLRTSPSVTRSVPDIARSTCGRPPASHAASRTSRAPPADVPPASHAASRTSRAPPADVPPASHAVSRLRALHLRTSPQRHTQRPGSAHSTCGRPPSVTRSVPDIARSTYRHPTSVPCSIWDSTRSTCGRLQASHAAAQLRAFHLPAFCKHHRQHPGPSFHKPEFQHRRQMRSVAITRQRAASDFRMEEDCGHQRAEAANGPGNSFDSVGPTSTTTPQRAALKDQSSQGPQWKTSGVAASSNT